MTKLDLINYLETDDFVYLNENGVYIGIFSNRDTDSLATDSYFASDTYSDDPSADIGKQYQTFSELWDNFQVEGKSLSEALATITDW
mgnify:CR=1 FL=1